jgi:hypothetical protein
MWGQRETMFLYRLVMTDFLDAPATNFQWGPQTRSWTYLQKLLPSLAIGAGLTFTLVGLFWLVPT